MLHVKWCNPCAHIVSKVNYKNGNSYTKFSLAWTDGLLNLAVFYVDSKLYCIYSNAR